MKKLLKQMSLLCLAAAALMTFAAAAETKTLSYDDRWDVSGQEAEIIDAGVHEGDAGGAVISLEDGVLRAIGVGTAAAEIDGVPYEITVEKAKLQLVMIMGQSNAGNHFANATSAVTCPPGTAYYWKYGATAPVDYTAPSKGFHTPLLAELYAQSAAAGEPVKNVLLWQEGVTSKNGKSIVKWAVESGSGISTSGTAASADMVEDCIAYYEEQSDRYEIVNKGVYWLQGESDYAMDPQRYMELFAAMWERLKDAGMEYLAFLRVRGPTYHNTAQNVDVDYNGASTAQFELVRSREDMFMATTLTEEWTGPVSTSHSIDVSNYITVVETYGKRAEYSDSYGNKGSYADGVLTTTMKELYGSNNKVHYGIFGYGLIGADAAYHMYGALNETEEAAVVQTDSSGLASAATVSPLGSVETINIDEIDHELSFYPACGSPAGTMEITVLSGGEEITEEVTDTQVDSYGCILTKSLYRYEDPVIVVSYTSGGETGMVEYHIEYEDPCQEGHTYENGFCTVCGKEPPLVPEDWLAVPITLTEESEHLGFQIVDGTLTFHDFGKGEEEDYGFLPDYTNTSAVETKYDITPWYQRRGEIRKVVFDETIASIGAYTLTNMDKVEEIRIEHPEAELAKNLALFSTTGREAPLNIYGASSVRAEEGWIRGNSYRKLSEAVSAATMVYTDLESLAPELNALKDTLTAETLDPSALCRALTLVKDVPQNRDPISDYGQEIPGAEEILERLWELSSGSCGDDLAYSLEPAAQEGILTLRITGSGAMAQYSDPMQAPWHSVMEHISDVVIDEEVTELTAYGLPEEAVYHGALNSAVGVFARENGLELQLDKLRVLCIGNSHTADYSAFFPNILADLEDAGLETEITVSRSVIGSIGLYSGRNSNVNATCRSHLEAIKNQSGAYSNLKNNRYDLIIVQDYMESVVETPETFVPGMASFLQEVRRVVEENGKGAPEIAWFADWVDLRSTGGDNALYDGAGGKIQLDQLSREAVYEKSLCNIAAIEAAMEQGTPDMPDFVIHGSTIKQNAMSSYLGTTKIWDKNAYCLLERDTTHLTYELGRYLLGAGVMSEIAAQYRPYLGVDAEDLDVGAALTVENGPEAKGEGSQYTGSINEGLLEIIREAISSPEEFRQSAYREDPVDGAAEELCALKWDMSQAEDRATALAAAERQIAAVLEAYKGTFTAEIVDFVSPEQFDLWVTLHCGYSTKETEVQVRWKEPVRRTVSGRVIATGAASVSVGETEMTTEEDGSFAMEAPEGVFDVVVQKGGCLTYTVENVTAEEGDVVLPEITLVVGDVNGDEMINARDIGAFRKDFGKTVSNSANPYTDINGDGNVNARDINILRRNFGKSAAKDCTVEW